MLQEPVTERMEDQETPEQPAETPEEPAVMPSAQAAMTMDDLLAADAPPAVSLEEAQLQAVLEAVVYVAEEPLTVAQLALALQQPVERIRGLLQQLMDEFEKPEHGVAIREVAGGYKMATKAEHHETVRNFVKSLKPPLKLSLPALETLAVIAYKQPVTGPEIQEIRGVQGTGVLKTLLDRKLIAAAGRKNVIGKPILYKTTREFLLQFGLKDLSELPSLKEFEEIRRMALTEDAPEEPAERGAGFRARSRGRGAARGGTAFRLRTHSGGAGRSEQASAPEAAAGEQPEAGKPRSGAATAPKPRNPLRRSRPKRSRLPRPKPRRSARGGSYAAESRNRRAEQASAPEAAVGEQAEAGQASAAEPTGGGRCGAGFSLPTRARRAVSTLRIRTLRTGCGSGPGRTFPTCPFPHGRRGRAEPAPPSAPPEES